jgi:hypothetical protein
VADTDAVTPAGVAFPLEGRRGFPFPLPFCISGETLGFVRAAASSSSHPFLKVLLWYAALRRAKLVVGIFRRAQRLRIISVFVDPTLSTLLSFLLLLLFLLGFVVLFAPAVVSILYRFVAILTR